MNNLLLVTIIKIRKILKFFKLKWVKNWNNKNQSHLPKEVILYKKSQTLYTQTPRNRISAQISNLIIWISIHHQPSIKFRSIKLNNHFHNYQKRSLLLKKTLKKTKELSKLYLVLQQHWHPPIRKMEWLSLIRNHQ
jgi:hypothetical protein